MSDELGNLVKLADFSKPAGRRSGLHVVARGEGAGRTSRETEPYTRGHYHYVTRREIDVGLNSRGGIEVMGWFRGLWHSKLDERTLIREEKIARQVDEINEMVREFQTLSETRKKKRRTNGMARQDSDS